MTQKKLRNKVARLLRHTLGLNMAAAYKLARRLVADYDVDVDNVAYVLDCAHRTNQLYDLHLTDDLLTVTVGSCRLGNDFVDGSYDYTLHTPVGDYELSDYL